ncbi:MAG: DUF423 domain-containing protein [Bacteroidia bacterium]|nr:DUF423 domain-containing protein [Bacteroidota bacterium]MCZ2130829.1 DUF423 domain-containing protein [Bacteroidia bacterium]
MTDTSYKYSQLQKFALTVASFGLAIFVVLTAMGAHALKEVLENPDYNRVFSAATRHLMLGSIGIFVIVLLSNILTLNPKIPLVLMLLGLLFFSFNLLLYFFLKINGISLSFLGILAPIGGIMFTAAWLWFGIMIAKSKIK